MINEPVNEIYNTQNFTVIEIDNINNLDFIHYSIDEYGDSILVSDYGEIIATEYGSFLLESTNIILI